MSSVAEFGNFASTNMINEATAFKTVKSGTYDIQVNKTYEFNETEGFARVGGKAIAGGIPQGTVFFRLQWKEARGTTGKLKIGCRLYAQVLKALYPTKSVEELSHIDAKDVIADLEKFPVRAFISEYYSIPDATNQYGSRRTTPKTPEEVKAALEAGGTPKNEVLTITAIK